MQFLIIRSMNFYIQYVKKKISVSIFSYWIFVCLTLLLKCEGLMFAVDYDKVSLWLEQCSSIVQTFYSHQPFNFIIYSSVLSVVLKCSCVLYRLRFLFSNSVCPVSLSFFQISLNSASFLPPNIANYFLLSEM